MWLVVAMLIISLALAIVLVVKSYSKNNGSRSNQCHKYSVADMVNVGVNPAGMALTVDGRYLYVANNNNYGLTGSDNVTVIDTCTHLPLLTIESVSFDGPYTVTMNKCGTKAYVTNSNTTSITIIDVATHAVEGTIDGFDGPSGMVIVNSLNRAYVNNYGSPDGVGSGNGNTVSVVDLTTETITDTITVGLAPAAMAYSDGFLYVVNYVDGNTGTGTLTVIDTSTNTVLSTVNAALSGPYSITIGHKHSDPCSCTKNKSCGVKLAYVANFGSNNFWPYGTTVTVIQLEPSVPSFHTVRSIPVGIQPSGTALTQNGKYLLVSNYNSLYDGSALAPGQGTVYVIDTRNYKIKKTIQVGQSPSNIVVACHQIYVSNYTSNTVSYFSL